MSAEGVVERRRWLRPPRPWNAVRPTTAGAWMLLLVAGLTLAAANTGDNRVYAVLAALLAVLVLNSLLAEWNLRDLVVRRRLPAEAFAGEPAGGALVLENRRRMGAAWMVDVAELDGGRAVARFGRVGPGESAEEGARWTFPSRGQVRCGRVRVSSDHPFGLVRRWRDVDLPAALLVYPRPLPCSGEVSVAATGAGGSERPARAGDGEIEALRDYAPGDPVRRIHWRSSARVGRPLVALRGGEEGGARRVRLEGADEASIGRAAARVLDAFAEGAAVGLSGAGLDLPVRRGPSHRARLLGALAELPSALPGSGPEARGASPGGRRSTG